MWLGFSHSFYLSLLAEKCIKMVGMKDPFFDEKYSRNLGRQNVTTTYTWRHGIGGMNSPISEKTELKRNEL